MVLRAEAADQGMSLVEDYVDAGCSAWVLREVEVGCQSPSPPNATEVVGPFSLLSMVMPPVSDHLWGEIVERNVLTGLPLGQLHHR